MLFRSKANKKFILEKQPYFLSAGANTNLVLANTTAYLFLIGTGVTSLSIAGLDSSLGANLQGQFVVLTNTSDSNLIILNESAATSAENRIITGSGSNVTVSQNGTVMFIYDNDEGLFGSPARWRLVNGIQAAGGSSTNLTTINSSTSLTSLDDIVIANGSSIIVTLPNPGSLSSGKTFNIKNINTSSVTIQCATATIDGVASVLITEQYDSLTITTDGSNYFII
jgi:hypothetical protein